MASSHSSGLSQTPLPPDLQVQVLRFLTYDEQLLVGGLISRGASRRLNLQQPCTVKFSVPLPTCFGDAPWQPHLLHAWKQLNFRNKLRALSAAAASGSEFNLQLVWGLLRPCLFPELLRKAQELDKSNFYLRFTVGTHDAGTAAVRAGHPHLLQWLMQHGCPLDPQGVLQAAAEHSDLAGLQQVWEQVGYSSRYHDVAFVRPSLHLAAAAAALAGDAASDKVSWILSRARESVILCQQPGEAAPAPQQSRGGAAAAPQLHQGQAAPAAQQPPGVPSPAPQQASAEAVAALRWRPCLQALLTAAIPGAVASGSLPALSWLREQLLQLQEEGEELLAFKDSCVSYHLFAAALKHGHVAVADWLSDVAGCRLPHQDQTEEDPWIYEQLDTVWHGAASGGHAGALRWLLARRTPLREAALFGASGAGRLEMVQLLHGEHGLPLSHHVFKAAAGSGSVPTAAWLLLAGCPMSQDAYKAAARAGDAPMVQWLLQEARCPWAEDTLPRVLRCWPRDAGASRGVLTAVRALVEAGCPHGDDPAGTRAAAGWGNLPLLRYLHEELSWALGTRVLENAAECGCDAVLEWLVGRGCVPAAGRGLAGYSRAARKGNLGTLQCLRRLGLPWTEFDLDTVLLQGRPLPAVKWLVEQGAPWDDLGAVMEFFKGSPGRCGEDQDILTWLERGMSTSRQGGGGAADG